MNGKTTRGDVTAAGGSATGLIALALLAAAAPADTNAATTAAERPVAAVVQQEVDAYQRARQALNRADYARAVELLRRYRDVSPDGRSVPESYYWEGFALSRMESMSDLRQARDALRVHVDRYPDAATIEDARVLLARVRADLARRGDAEAARWVYENTADEDRDREMRGEPRAQERVRERGRQEILADEEKLAALQALMHMDSERALQILRRVVEDRDNAPELRIHALFIMSQRSDVAGAGDEGVAEMMLDAARDDPDPEVREQALFWLAQSGGERALPLLESILENPDDRDLHEHALFGLTQVDDPRATEVLRNVARSSSMDREIRQTAIFWLGQRAPAENAPFLRDLWDSAEDGETREAILFSLSQMEVATNAGWLMDIALDESEGVEVRKQALFLAGQRDDVDAAALASLYDRAPDREMKQQALFVLSQKGDDPAAVDEMIEIVRREEDPELRRKAIFWLGQSGDPRAEEALLEVIEQ